MCWEDIQIARSKRSVPHVLALANGTITKLPSNPSRVGLLLSSPGPGAFFFSPDPAMTTATSFRFGDSPFTILAMNIEDWGQLVTADLYFTAGANINAVVTELILDVLVVGQPARRESA